MKYVAVDIGCIECGEESYVLGIFDDAESAQTVADECNVAQQANWNGQHYFQVFQVEHDNRLCCIPDYATHSNLIARLRELGIEEEK